MSKECFPTGEAMNRKGFTLLELLVVVGIIMLLAGLLFPAFNRARISAKNAKAKADVKQLDMAFRAAQMDNRGFTGALDTSGGAQDMDKSRVDYLKGLTSPNNVIYMEFDQGSLDSGQGFIDPWKKRYRVVTQNSSAGTAATVTPDSGVTIARPMAAWSCGADRVGGNKDDIKSWE